MSLFRFVKYSSILFFLNKHRSKMFRSVAVLLFALVTSLLYEDLRVFLAQQHPESLIYALVGKFVIVYGALIFVLLQFRPGGADRKGEARAQAVARKGSGEKNADSTSDDRLEALKDLQHHGQLRTRYDRVLAGDSSVNPKKSVAPDP